MSKRNSNFSIYSHLRMLLRLFPVRDAVAFRMAVAARIEADEATGEVFPVGNKSPRERLQDAAGIGRTNSVDEALSTIKKVGLIRGHRIYSRGERQKGGDRLVLEWSKWEDACLNNGQEACPALDGGQGGCPPENAGQPTPLSGGQATPLSGGQQYIRKTAIVTAKKTSMGPPPLAAGSTPPPTVGMADTSNLKSPKVGSELQLQEPGVVVPDEGISWVEPKNLPAGYAQSVWFNRRLGKLYLVQGELGLAFYRSLRDDGFSPAAIRQGLTAAGAKAAGVANGPKARGGALEGLVRQYVGYAQEKEDQAVARTSGHTGAFQGRPRMFVP